MKTNFFKMEFKSVENKGDYLLIEGYASTPDIDKNNDITLPSAFDTMEEYMQDGGKVLRQHLSYLEVGFVEEYRIEEAGLWVRIRITSNVNNTIEDIKSGKLNHFSFGFYALKFVFFEKDGKTIRELQKVKIVEISVVEGQINDRAIFGIAESTTNLFNDIEQKALGNYEYIGEKLEYKAETIETPPVVEEEIEEEQNKPTNPKNIEIASGNLADDEEGIKREEELKTLKEEVELLKKENVELKATLLARDEELENIQELKAKTEKELEEKNLEIKSYLGNGNIPEYKANILKPTQKTYIYSEFL